MVEVRQSNPNAFRDIEKQLRQLDNLEARVGWFENAKYPDGTPVAYAASIQEHGYGPIKPRLGLRALASKLQDEWREVAIQVSKRVVDGKMDGLTAMKLIAEQVQNDVLDRITSSPGPALKPLTLAIRKKREQGVKITGRLIGELARKLEEGKPVALSGNTRALDDTNTLISHLDSKVTKS